VIRVNATFEIEDTVTAAYASSRMICRQRDADCPCYPSALSQRSVKGNGDQLLAASLPPNRRDLTLTRSIQEVPLSMTPTPCGTR
jgi:hypothetical protein